MFVARKKKEPAKLRVLTKKYQLAKVDCSFYERVWADCNYGHELDGWSGPLFELLQSGVSSMTSTTP